MTSKKLSGEVVSVCGEHISLLELADEIERCRASPSSAPTSPPRSGDVQDSQADITRAGELLGYEPVVRWREGLERTFRALRG